MIGERWREKWLSVRMMCARFFADWRTVMTPRFFRQCRQHDWIVEEPILWPSLPFQKRFHSGAFAKLNKILPRGVQFVWNISW